MSIQRTRYEIQISRNEDQTKGAVALVIHFDGTYEDRGDALLMIADAWMDAMKEAGFDPLKSISTMSREGTLQ